MAYIHFVGVAPGHRRAGLGATLYHAFFEHIARLGARTVKCITTPGNETSVVFHIGLGFALEPSENVTDDIPVQRDYDGPGLDRVAFKRTLKSPRSPAPPVAAAEYVRGETDLTALLRGLTPRQNTGAYVYVRVSAIPEGAEPMVVVEEAEGTTLVLRQEQAVMRALPECEPDLDRRWVLRVPPDPHVRFDTNDYSLDPHLVSRRVEVRASQREITAVGLDTGELAARHERSFAKNRTVTALEHARTLRERRGQPAVDELVVEQRPLSVYDQLIA